MGCILAPPGEYDRTVRVRRRCGLMLNYFGKLVMSVVAGPLRGVGSIGLLGLLGNEAVR